MSQHKQIKKKLMIFTESNGFKCFQNETKKQGTKNSKTNKANT